MKCKTPIADGILTNMAMRSGVKFCWHCGRKLYGGKGVGKFIEGHFRVLHKQCLEDIESGRNIIRDRSYE